MSQHGPAGSCVAHIKAKGDAPTLSIGELDAGLIEQVRECGTDLGGDSNRKLRRVVGFAR